MRPMRVCIYGGTDLQDAPRLLVSELACQILDSMPSVIVTGGFLKSTSTNGMSTDAAALEGARQYVRQLNPTNNLTAPVDVRACFEAWVPDPRLDRRPQTEGVVRMTEADGVMVRAMTGRTALGRRLAMVGSVDMVVTISGREHTEVVAEQALEIGIPLLPIPNAGGDSEDLLGDYHDRIAAAFEPGELDRCLDELTRVFTTDTRAAARAVVALMRTARVGRCLVLLPFDEEHDGLFESTIEPAIARHMIPLRLDRLPRSDAIYSSFADAVRSSTAVIADITALNENVMYEVGYAHGLGLAPLIYTRDAARLERLPVYFRALNVRVVTHDMPLAQLVDEYLRSLKATRRMSQAGDIAGPDERR